LAEPRGATFRPYEPADRDALIALFEEFQDGFVDMDPLLRTRRMPGYAEAALTEVERVARDHAGLFAVAEDESGIVGFVAASVHHTTPAQELEGPAETWGRVDELFVRPTFRGRALGRELMEHAERFLRAAGCVSVRVQVFAPNVLVHAFYRGLGYADRDVDLIKLLAED
jgi:GNAT superfamily N-acetyltransferase